MSCATRFKIGTVFDPIDLAHQALVEWFGIEKPRIAVCGLNPHASENGQFGDEEKRIIEPAIMMARQHGIDATGPFPADTVFIKAVQGHYDLVVAMYHDQGLIPVKLLDFNGSVNLTLGLPIVRTSPDHGTAFDIVGKNKADPGSMKAAIRMAAEIATMRRRAANTPEPPASPSARLPAQDYCGRDSLNIFRVIFLHPLAPACGGGGAIACNCWSVSMRACLQREFVQLVHRGQAQITREMVAVGLHLLELILGEVGLGEVAFDEVHRGARR